eukprot:403352342
MLDAFYLNTEDLQFFTPLQHKDQKLSQDELINQQLAMRLQQRNNRQAMMMLEVSNTSLAQSNGEFQSSLLALSRPMTIEGDGKFQQLKVIIHDIGQQFDLQQQSLMRQSFPPGVVPATGANMTSDNELQKIYTQKQYTEIAMSILSSLKTQSNQSANKKFKGKNASVLGNGTASNGFRNASQNLRDIGSQSYRQDHSPHDINIPQNATSATIHTIYRQTLPQKNQHRSLKERAMINLANSNYDSQQNINYHGSFNQNAQPNPMHQSMFKDNLTQRSQDIRQRESITLPEFSKSFYNSNTKSTNIRNIRKDQEKLFQQELAQRYNQIKKETNQQWDKIYHDSRNNVNHARTINANNSQKKQSEINTTKLLSQSAMRELTKIVKICKLMVLIVMLQLIVRERTILEGDFSKMITQAPRIVIPVHLTIANNHNKKMGIMEMGCSYPETKTQNSCLDQLINKKINIKVLE